MRESAFTLIELLVVMGILSILASLVIPSLRQARDRAQEAHCKTNVHQWSVVLALYHEDLSGFVDTGKKYWPHSVRDYIEPDTILYCPKATRTKPPGHGNGPDHRGSTSFAWWTDYTYGDGIEVKFSGSYGKNGWIAHTKAEGWFGATSEHFWHHTIEIDRPDTVPLIMDSAWFHPLPLHADPPPPQFDHVEPYGFGQNMWLVAMDRHTATINVACMDGSARRVGLKGLWNLRWNPQWNRENRWTAAGGVRPGDWPAWMRNMEAY